MRIFVIRFIDAVRAGKGRFTELLLFGAAALWGAALLVTGVGNTPSLQGLSNYPRWVIAAPWLIAAVLHLLGIELDSRKTRLAGAVLSSGLWGFMVCAILFASGFAPPSGLYGMAIIAAVRTAGLAVWRK